MSNEENVNVAYRWLQRYKPEYVEAEKESSRIKTKILHCLIKWMREYIDQHQPGLVTLNSIDYDAIPFWFGVMKYMNIDFIENEEKDDRVYMLQMLLILRGYDCEITGNYSKFTRNKVSQFKKDYEIKRSFNSGVDWEFWYKLIYNKKEVIS